MGACKLNRRSGFATLPVSTVSGVAGAEQEVLTAQSEGVGDGEWRIIDLWSDERTPWEARLVWSGGGGAQRTAYLDVPKSTRVCVHATTLQVFGSNLSTATAVTARVAIADGQTGTENQYAVRGTAQVAGGAIDVEVPPWARFVRLEVSDATAFAASSMELQDANGTSYARYDAATQPQPGAPIGDAHVVRCTLPGGNYAYRVVFLLHL